MTIVEVRLNLNLRSQLNKASRKKRWSPMLTAKIAFERGVEITEVIHEDSLVRRTDNEIRSEMAEIDKDIESFRQNLLKISAETASEHFFSYEGYQRVSSILRIYLVRRSEAHQLAQRLERQGIHFDLSAGDVGNLEDLEVRYLFKKKQLG